MGEPPSVPTGETSMHAGNAEGALRTACTTAYGVIVRSAVEKACAPMGDSAHSAGTAVEKASVSTAEGKASAGSAEEAASASMTN